MQILGIIAYDDSVLGDVNELRLAFERLGYAVHLEQLGHDLTPIDFGYFEEDSLLLWLGRCYNDPARCREIASKFAESEIDLIVAMKAPAVLDALEITAGSDIPVVFTHISDLALQGLTSTFADARDRLTGVCSPWINLSCERLALLEQIVPAPSAVHILTDLDVPVQAAEVECLKAEAEQLGLELIVHPVSSALDAIEELARLKAHANHALFRLYGFSFTRLSGILGATAREKYIPYVGIHAEEMERCGALFTLEQRGVANPAANLADRILKGEKPGDLPYALPERNMLGVNLLAAQDLGLVVSPAVLERATNIIPKRERASLRTSMLFALFILSSSSVLFGAVAVLNPNLPWVAASLGTPVAIAIILWLYLQRRIIHPIRQLTAAVEKIDDRFLDVEIGESRIEDEIGVLGRAFRQMRSNLKYSHSELEKLTTSLKQQIQERTAAYRALQKAQQELETASRRIIEADDSSRFAMTTYIHDEVLSLLDDLVSKARRCSDPTIEQLALTVDQHIRWVRFELSVPVIQDMNVELHRLLQEILPQFYPQSSKVKLIIDLSSLRDLPVLNPACSVLLYRFVSGAVSNAYRHASARHVTVTAQKSQGMLLVQVCDDGIGFAPDAIENFIGQGHYFFHDVAVRSRQLGGSFQIETQPGKGTCLEIAIPVSSGVGQKINLVGKANRGKRR